MFNSADKDLGFLKTVFFFISDVVFVAFKQRTTKFNNLKKVERVACS